MMSAIFAAQNGEVTILERNEKLGKKLYITGKGRCNITNLSGFNDYIENTVSNPRFASGALRMLPPEAVIKMMESNGLPTKTERGNRVFPISDKSNDVIKTFKKMLDSAGVTVLYNQKVVDFVLKDNKIIKILTENDEFFPDKVILATGGKSYSATGSDGSGYALAQSCGHTIVPLRPALAPLILESCYSASGQRIAFEKLPSLQGLSLKNVEASIRSFEGKVLHKEFGEMLFTHNGVSGPIILSLSSKINRINLKDISLTLDLKPALDFQMLDKRLLRDFDNNKNKFYKNSLNDLLPSKLIAFIIALSGINGEAFVNNITREQRHGLAALLKTLKFDIAALADINQGIVTAGGVCVKEINPKTMQSKLVDNLYFAGEIIDIDALTGGYNLQLAFSTGCAAGNQSIR